MLELTPTENDDPEFVELVTRLLRGAAHCYQPTKIYVVQIDNWFDHKWTEFSGVVHLQLGVWCGAALTVPPFNPHRVVSQIHYQRQENGYQIATGWRLHGLRASVRNTHRHLKAFVGPDSLLLWYSGGTKIKDRASLMVYRIEQSEETTWYVSFSKRDEWRVHKSKGISQQEFADLAQLSAKPPIA